MNYLDTCVDTAAGVFRNDFDNENTENNENILARAGQSLELLRHFPAVVLSVQIKNTDAHKSIN